MTPLNRENLMARKKRGCECPACEATATALHYLRERDEALLSATFREDKHAEELGEKLMAALAQVAALREALVNGAPFGSDYDADRDVVRWWREVACPALNDTAAAAAAHDERVRAEERERCAKVAERLEWNDADELISQTNYRDELCLFAARLAQRQITRAIRATGAEGRKG